MLNIYQGSGKPPTFPQTYPGNRRFDYGYCILYKVRISFETLIHIISDFMTAYSKAIEHVF